MKKSKFDTHCHTAAGSIDASITIESFISILQENDFDGMLVTDHDSYKGYDYYLKNRDKMPKDFTVLMAVEYDTTDAGHFIVIMPDDIRLKLLTTRGLPLQELIYAVHKCGGILGPAHPYGARSSSAMRFRFMWKNPELIRQCDFVEGLNVCEKKYANIMAARLAKRYGLPCFGGSDAHKEKYVGMAYTLFHDDITCNDDLIEYIKSGRQVDFGGVERDYLRRHYFRNGISATYAFRGYNKLFGLLKTPVRSSRFKKAKQLLQELHQKD